MAYLYTEEFFKRLFDSPEVRKLSRVVAGQMLQRQPATSGPLTLGRYEVQNSNGMAFYTCEACIEKHGGTQGFKESHEIVVKLQGEVPGLPQLDFIRVPLGVVRVTARRAVSYLPPTTNVPQELLPFVHYAEYTTITLDAQDEVVNSNPNRKYVHLLRHVQMGTIRQQARLDTLCMILDWVCPKCPPNCSVHYDWRQSDALWGNMLEDCCAKGVCQSCQNKGCAHTHALHIERTLQYPATIGHYSRNY